MKKKVSNAILLASLETMKGMLDNKDYSTKFNYAIGKNVIIIEKELEAYNMSRNKLIEKYAKRDENDKFIIEDNQIELTSKEEFDKEIEELLKIENEVDFFDIKLSTLFENKNVSSRETIAIDYMLVED